MSAIFGNQITFLQENGPSVQLKVFGDEFYARYETGSGYTCVCNTGLDLYSYATLIDDELVSTGISMARPPADGVRLGLGLLCGRHPRPGRKDDFPRYLIDTRHGFAHDPEAWSPYGSKSGGWGTN